MAVYSARLSSRRPSLSWCRGKYRTYVKGVVKGSQAEARGVKVPALVVSVNGANVEGLPASYVVKLFKDAQGEGREEGRAEGGWWELKAVEFALIPDLFDSI